MAALNTTNVTGTPNVSKNGARQRRKVAQYATGGTQSNADIINATALTRQEKRVKTAAGAHSALGVETIGQTVWSLLGLTSDPFLTYHVTADIVAAGSASGDICLEMVYTAGD